MTGLFTIVIDRADGRINVFDVIYPTFDLANDARRTFGGDRVVEVKLVELTGGKP